MKRILIWWYKYHYKVHTKLTISGIEIYFSFSYKKPRVIKDVVFMPIRYLSPSNETTKLNVAEYVRKAFAYGKNKS